jgi:hypothetical protein
LTVTPASAAELAIGAGSASIRETSMKSGVASSARETAGVGNRVAPSCEDAAQLRMHAAISGVRARAPAMARPPSPDPAPALLIKG